MRRASTVDGRPVAFELGWLLRVLLGAGALGAVGAVLGIPLIAGDVADAEGDINKLQRHQGVIEENVRSLDEGQRYLKMQNEWANRKLDALMKERRIDPVIPPALEPTKLKKPAQ